MDHWIKLSGEVPCLSLIPLGSFPNKYCMDPECLNNLKEINAKLSCEEPNTRPLIAYAIGFFNVLNEDLIHILHSSKDQPTICPSIFPTTITYSNVYSV
ncbi:hypothetical protein DAPPUDRAFT_312499 [Daphnia pulex]|uniref:Timeless N-terminal domain-containing protein n=1 Tax=Daphnia pulex TaxID=6669 RepID=E9FZ83_DAPPU|nr:hypothetical protein DAPPUDRAFT_312499 [Daphnia pulex]|eukprot:EFX87310.1 hypothetical protein DAPPUDRAFT_312499 [Daphnia pulex]